MSSHVYVYFFLGSLIAYVTSYSVAQLFAKISRALLTYLLTMQAISCTVFFGILVRIAYDLVYTPELHLTNIDIGAQCLSVLFLGLCVRETYRVRQEV